jgi:hypothetical protein
MRVLVFADTHQEATPRGSGDHVAVQHEAQPAKHPHFRHRAGPSENGAHALGEILIQSHGLALEPMHAAEHQGRADSKEADRRSFGSSSHVTHRWREMDSNPRSPLGEEREYEISRQDREIASRRTMRSATASEVLNYLSRQFGMTVRPNHLGMALQRHRRAGQLENRDQRWYLPPSA